MQTRFESTDRRYRYARPTDLDPIVSTLEDPEVGRWLWFTPATASELRTNFKRIIETQWQTLADGVPPDTALFIVEDPDGSYVGLGAVLAVPGSAGGFEIGFQLAKAAWGRGVGTAVAQFLATWAVVVRHAHRLQAGCLEGNQGSRRILEKLGLKLEGTRPEFRLKGDVRHTELDYGAVVAELDAASFQTTAELVGME